MSEQQALMNIIANLAIVGGAILALIVAKDTITGVLGQRASGVLKNAQQGLNNRSLEGIKKSRVGEAKQAYDRRKLGRRVARRLGDGRLAKTGKGLTDKYGENSRLGRLGKAVTAVGSVNKTLDSSSLGRYIGGDAGAASAVVARQNLDSEAVKNRMAQINDADPSVTIKNALAALEKAQSGGDIIGARAASRVLLTETGSAGIEKFHKIVTDIEDQRGGLHRAIDEGMRVEANQAGLKGKDRSVDNWSRREDGSQTLSSFDNGIDALKGMNEREIAGQSETQLKKFAASGALTSDMAQRILNANQQGTIELSDEKLRYVNAAIRSSTNPRPSSGGENTVRNSGRNFTQDPDSGLFIPRQ